MKKHETTKWLNYLIAMVWITNGLFCKVLNLVPRHQQIVEKILTPEHARFWTMLIGVAEVGMAMWILSGIFPRINAVTQIAVIGTMNFLEFVLAPDLLLWGRLNALFAGLFMLLVAFSEFYVRNRFVQQT